MRTWLYLGVLGLCTAGFGCETRRTSLAPPNAPGAPPKAPSSATQTDGEQASVVEPHYETLELQINNHKFGPNNGSTMTFVLPPPGSGAQIKWESRCGHPGAVSNVSWTYLRSDQEGDHYRFAREFPVDAPSRTTVTKEVLFTGDEIVLFEDEVQRILLRRPSQRAEED